MVAVLGAVTLLLASACTEGSEEAGSEESEEAGSEERGAEQPSAETLVVDTTFDQTILDPSQGTTTALLTHMLRFDTLLTFDNGVPVPHLAESFEASPDNREFTFDLRDDVQFGDGTPLTAADVVFTYKRAVGMGLEGGQLLAGFTVSAPDEHTVVLTSETPNAALPAIVAVPLLGVFNSELARSNGASDAADAAQSDTAEDWFSSAESQGAGSGPYVLVENTAGTEISFERNEQFWGDPAGYAEVVMRNVAAETQALNVRRGSHEIALNLSVREVPSLENDPNLNVVTELSPQQVHLFSNINPSVSPISSNQHFKNALMYAIDYEAILELAGTDAVQPATVIPALWPGVLPPDEAPQRDLERAQDELAASGVENPSITLEYVGGTEYAGGLPNDSVAQIVQRSLQDVGIDVELQAQPGALLIERYRTGQIPWGIVPGASLIPDVAGVARFAPGRFLGLAGGWQEGMNPTLEELISNAEQATGDERLDLWQDVQRRMAEEGPWIPLVGPVGVIVTTSDVDVSDIEFVAGRLNLRSLHPAS